VNNCTVKHAGEGEKFWLVGDHPTIKLSGAQTGGAYAVTENWTGPGGGPPPHVHANEDEMFYVIEGKLGLMLDGKTFTADAGEAVYLPKGLPHAFKNIGDVPVRFLIVATPAGFESFVAAAGTRIETIPCDKAVDGDAIAKLLADCPQWGITILPPDYQPTGPAPQRPKCRELWALGQHVTLKLTAADTGGKHSLCEVRSDPGTGVPPHFHHREDEMFYVLHGTYAFQLGDDTVTAEAGTFVHVPKGTLHGFRNVGTTPGMLLDCHTPGGFEQFFEDIGFECVDVTAAPPGGAPDMAKVMAAVEKHGMVMTPPSR
jgi:mannose-6-phosphate isomerase-like protein (cupin superfamily)